MRDEAKGRTVTYSRKVFIPLTTLCNDTCTYCTFAKPPGAGGEYLEPEEVMAFARLGEQHHCTEALFTLGDRPEQTLAGGEQSSWPTRGHTTTLRICAGDDRAGGGRDRLVPPRQSRPDERRRPPGAAAVQSFDGDDAGEHLAPADGTGDAPPRRPRQGARSSGRHHRGSRPHPRFRSPPAFLVGNRGGTGRGHRQPVRPGRPSRNLGEYPRGDRPELPGQSRHSHAALARADRPLLRQSRGRCPLDHGSRDERPGPAQPHRALRGVPRGRDQRLGRRVSSHHRLGESGSSPGPISTSWRPGPGLPGSNSCLASPSIRSS